MGREITVDLWKTGMHSVEVGIKKQAEHRAKSRQFTSDSDLIGEYDYKEGKSKGYLSIRNDPWKAEPTKQRLILKMFTESMNWKGTLEEIVAVGLSRTLAVGGGMPAFSVNLTNHDSLIRVEKMFKPKSFNKPMYVFMIAENNTLHSYRIESERMSVGSDWKVFDKYGHKVAEIDGAALNVGGKWKIKIEDKFPLHPIFDEMLILFSGLARYVDDIGSRLEKVADMLDEKDSNTDLVIDSDEIGLYNNPRRMKY
ncbi:MAG: hypothetical protein ACXAE3_10810 [Candidatus Kariarchaeaceae archaeon]|jgi:hypothetical protein